MSKGVNKVILLGHLGRDPELRKTQSGTAVANFTLATTERQKIGDEWQDKTEWHNLVAWGKTAETCAEHLKKGSQVFIEGRLQTRKWEDKDGNTRHTTEIVVLNLVMSGRPKAAGTGAPATSENDGFDPNDDVPF